MQQRFVRFSSFGGFGYFGLGYTCCAEKSNSVR